MTEYIEREKARDAVYKRIEELRADKEFNIIKEICVSGVKKHIASIPTADVIEREKIDNAIEEIEQYLLEEEVNGNHEKGIMFVLEILEKNGICKRNIGE